MNPHILISVNAEFLARCREAFPGAVSCSNVQDAIRHKQPGATVWLHLPADRNDAGRLVNLATKALAPAHLVALSDSPSDEQALDLMDRGAAGYCHSYAGPAMLQQVATVVGNQGLWVGPGLLTRLIKASMSGRTQTGAGNSRLDALSVREHDVAAAVGQGHSNKEIARQLNITERTVKAHLSAIFLKLGVRDRVHLALLVRDRSS